MTTSAALGATQQEVDVIDGILHMSLGLDQPLRSKAGTAVIVVMVVPGVLPQSCSEQLGEDSSVLVFYSAVQPSDPDSPPSLLMFVE